ncbi:unnamed protein product [Dovyalis caffra]|uniref:Uncharacterized protein n=1 Tax=Dovyalis caffra TaxID=77055 RepID=A0AAV1RWF0_9ROSI|nr:unnamed protein product [Dovyalis caffra]
MELGALLDPGSSLKVDKSVILVDAARMAKKNELRDEKQRLKTEKENLERQVKALSASPTFLPHPPTIPAPFSAQGQAVGSNPMPFVGYPRISMWQFMPPTVVDTSQDHVLRPLVA